MPAWQSDSTLLTEDWKQSPNNASILARYASHIEEDEDNKEQLYLNALSIYPNFFGAHYDLARLYYTQHRYALAHKHFNEASKLKSSDDIQFNLELCTYHIFSNKVNRHTWPITLDMLSISSIQRGLFFRRGDGQCLSRNDKQLGYNVFELNTLDTAYDLLTKALKQDSNHLDYAQEGLNMACQAENPSRAVDFGLYFAHTRADDSTTGRGSRKPCQGNEMLLEHIQLRKSAIFSTR